MHQLKIIIKFNTSSIKSQQNKEDNIKDIKNRIEPEKITKHTSSNNNKTFNSLNNLGRKKKQ